VRTSPIIHIARAAGGVMYLLQGPARRGNASIICSASCATNIASRVATLSALASTGERLLADAYPGGNTRWSSILLDRIPIYDLKRADATVRKMTEGGGGETQSIR